MPFALSAESWDRLQLSLSLEALFFEEPGFLQEFRFQARQAVILAAKSGDFFLGNLVPLLIFPVQPHSSLMITFSMLRLVVLYSFPLTGSFISFNASFNLSRTSSWLAGPSVAGFLSALVFLRSLPFLRTANEAVGGLLGELISCCFSLKGSVAVLHRRPLVVVLSILPPQNVDLQLVGRGKKRGKREDTLLYHLSLPVRNQESGGRKK